MLERAAKKLYMEPDQVRRALMGAWLLSGAVGLFCVLLPLLAPAEAVFAFSPQCTWQAQTGLPCPACGLTRGFVAMAALDIGAAQRANPAAPWLFGLFIVNGLAALFAAANLVRKRLALNNLSLIRGI